MNGFTWDDENLLLTDLSGTSTLKRREEKRREEKRRIVSNFNSVNLKSREGPDYVWEFSTFLHAKNM